MLLLPCRLSYWSLYASLILLHYLDREQLNDPSISVADKWKNFCPIPVDTSCMEARPEQLLIQRHRKQPPMSVGGYLELKGNFNFIIISNIFFHSSWYIPAETGKSLSSAKTQEDQYTVPWNDNGMEKFLSLRDESKYNLFSKGFLGIHLFPTSE